MQDLFNPVECWNRMTPDQQRTFGAAGIAHLLGTFGSFADPAPLAYVAADFEGFELMIHTLEEVLPELRTDPARPNLGVLGIRTCRKCGCTDNCGCGGGCSWVEDDLCSTCA